MNMLIVQCTWNVLNIEGDSKNDALLVCTVKFQMNIKSVWTINESNEKRRITFLRYR